MVKVFLLLSGIGINFASNHIKDIDLLLSGFIINLADGINHADDISPINDIDLANDIDSTDSISSESSVLGTISLGITNLKKSQIAGFEIEKNAIDVIT